MKMRTHLVMTFFVVFMGHLLQSQTTDKQVYIIYSQLYFKHEKPDGIEEWVGGEVRLRQDSTFLYCDTASLFGPIVTAIGNTAIVQGDSLRIFADSLIYYSDQYLATFVGNVVMENGDQRLVTDRLYYNTLDRRATYDSGAWLSSEGSIIYSRLGAYHVRERLVTFSDSVQVQQTDFRLKADSMKYLVPEDKVIFTGPTRIHKDRAQLYCESGYYLLEKKEGWFEEQAEYLDSLRVATADRIYYNQLADRFILIGDAFYKEKTREAYGDTISFDGKSGDFKVRKNARLIDAKQEVLADGIDYNTKSEKLRTYGKSEMRDGAQILNADQVYSADTSNMIILSGNIFWKDTIERIILLADSAKYQKDMGFLHAMGSPPLLMSIIEEDTLFLIADNIISFRSDSLDSTRIIQAYPNVFGYKKDFQVICDSMGYVGKDSMFTFYSDPVAWSEDTTQFTADTISIRMVNNSIDSIFLIRNSLLINSPDDPYYNQIKGRMITGIMKERKVSHMHVIGNAEAIYYVQDDEDAYIGVNKSICSSMLILFDEQQIKDIYYFREPTSSMNPMEEVDHVSLRLEGFRWRDDERPLGLADMIRRWNRAHENHNGHNHSEEIREDESE